MRLTFGTHYTEKSWLPSIMCAGLIQTTEGLNRTADRHLCRREFSCPTTLSLDIGICLAFGLELKHGLLLSLRPLDLDWNSTFGSPGCVYPSCWLTPQIFELASHHNYRSQFLIINLFMCRNRTSRIYICIHTHTHVYIYRVGQKWVYSCLYENNTIVNK